MLGALPGVIGTLQAMEALKILTNYGESLAGRMLHYDAATTSFRDIKLKRNPECALCGGNPSITAPLVYEESCGVEQVGIGEIDVAQLQSILANGFDGILLDVRERDEHAWAHIEGCRLAPLSEFPSHLANLPVDQPYLVYCKVGQRSAHAAVLMQEAGIRNVTNVQGGILAWLQAEGPVVKG